MSSLVAIFGSKDHLGMAQECARAVLIFAYGLLLVRLAGRRVFGKWAALDIIVSIIVGSNLSRAITGSAPLAGTLLATAALMALHWLCAQAAARWAPMSRLLEGRAAEIVSNGRIEERTRIWHAVSRADLDEAVRQRGLGDPQEAGQVMLEPSGKLTVRTRD